MKKMRYDGRKTARILCLLLLLLFLMCVFAGCNPNEPEDGGDEIEINAKAEKDYDVYAIYFPNWGSQNGEVDGWNPLTGCEWYRFPTLTEKFEGQRQISPLWGYLNHSDPEVMAKIIDTVTDYGIDGFVFDWYWYESVRLENRGTNNSEDGNGMYLGGELTNGFLGAENNTDMKFGILWCNHDDGTANGKAVFDDPEEWEIMTDYIIENYFSRENYIRIDGKLYFGILNIQSFVEIFKNEYGSTDIRLAKEAWERFEQKTADAGLGEIGLWVYDNRISQIDASAAWEGGLPPSDWDSAEYLGVDAFHTFLPNGMNDYTEYRMYDLNENGKIYDFKTYSDVKVKVLREYMERYKESNPDILYSPSAISGYDSSYRIAATSEWTGMGNYPDNAVIHNVTPENYKNECLNIRNLLDEYGQTTVFLNSYNEWTEGSYLEPDTTYGYGYLKVIKEVFSLK